MPWKGNSNNPAPNNVHEPINRSEKIIADNRENHVRRDTDSQKDITISLYDIDETILLQLEQFQLQVQDSGKQIKVPVFFGSPERWVAAQRDGYMRDNQGKVILPAIILKRTSSEKDASLQYFNRYLNSSVIKLYSHKNQYTKFNALSGENAPTHEVYNMVFPSHMTLTYHFIIWTEYIEQMNTLVETIQFNTKDYWGSTKGFRFRTKVDSFSHTVELQANEDRVVKTEFDLITHGYILPDTMTKLEKHQLTTNKVFTPKKIIMGAEIVAPDYNMELLNNNRDKWRSPLYPNIQSDVVIDTPKTSVVEGTSDKTIAGQILNTLRSYTPTTPTEVIADSVNNNVPYLRIVSPPASLDAFGYDGYVAYDESYFYIYSSNSWRRVAIAQFA